MSGALRMLEPDACEELDEALVADYAEGAARRLFRFDAALAAARTDPATVVELVRVLRALADGVASHGFHALGRRALLLEAQVLRSAGGPGSALCAELDEFRAEMAEAFAEARRQVEPGPGWLPGRGSPPPARLRWRQRRLVLAVLEARPSLTGAAAGTALARAATHLICTGGAAAQAYRESWGDGLVLQLGGDGARSEPFSDLALPGAGERSAVLAALCDGAVLIDAGEQPLADARALLAAGRPVAQVPPRAAAGALAGCGPGRLLSGADARRAVLAVLVELSRDR